MKLESKSMKNNQKSHTLIMKDLKECTRIKMREKLVLLRRKPPKKKKLKREKNQKTQSIDWKISGQVLKLFRPNLQKYRVTLIYPLQRITTKTPLNNRTVGSNLGFKITSRDRNLKR
jgi:hypothetical protein